MYRLLTVTTPAISKDLTTVAAVKADLGVSSTANDAVLATMVTQASKFVAKYCRREFVAETVTETFRPYPFVDSASLNNLPDYIWLRRTPVVAFSQDGNGNLLFTRDGEALTENVDFECDHSIGRIVWLWNDMPLRWHFRKLVIPYIGGFTTGHVDDDVQRATIETVKQLWFFRSRDPYVKAHEIPNVASITYADVMRGGWPTPQIAALLAPWQAPVF